MDNNTSSAWIKEAYNGGGWENSQTISSVEELRSTLLDLGASVSFDDNFQGVTRANVNLSGSLYVSETEIDSYRSYLTSKKFDSNIYNGNGIYHDSNGSYNGSPASFSISSTNNFLQSLPAGLNPGEKAYLALNIDSTGLGLENGFNVIPTPATNPGIPHSGNNHILSTKEVNPEIVLELDNVFWEDNNNIRNEIDQQRSIGDNIQFDIGFPYQTIDLSSLRYSNDSSSIDNILEKFNFTLTTNERWDLPLYGGDIHANINLKSGDYSTHLNVRLKDHDSTGHQPPAASQGFTGAVELTEDGNGTVLEFGLDEWHLKEIVKTVQRGWNNAGSETTFEIENVNFNFNHLPGGGSYTTHKTIPIYDQYLTIKPVTTTNSNFSEFNDVNIQVSGDFNSVIDFWNSDANTPNIQLVSSNGLSKYQNVGLTLNYQAVDESGHDIAGQHLNISSNLNDLSSDAHIHAAFTGGNYSSDITDFRLTNINYSANPWDVPGGSNMAPPAVNWNYHYDSGSNILYHDQNGNPVFINDIISNVEDLHQISFSGLDDLSQADNLNASVELTLEDNRLPWNVNYTAPEASDTLETYYSLQELDQLAVLGDSVDESSRYDLTITAKMLGDLRLEGASLTIGFDNTIFNDLDASNIYIGNSFTQSYGNKETGYGPIRVDNEAGKIHISAISAEDLGLGESISEESIFATISLDFDETALRGLEQNEDGSFKTNPLSFSITADENETIFTEDLDDGTNFSNRNIQSLRDLGKEIIVEGRDITLYNAAINLEQLGDGLVLGTKRVIGANQGYTNLIRSGDTITSTVDWRNVGNITAKNLQVYGEYNEFANLKGHSLSQNSLKSGSFRGGQFYEEGREDVTITADIEVTGAAGNVLDVSEGIFSVEADGSSISFKNNGQGSSNLITYQGDLNYDGRVSMKDLAYLNAGAARQIEKSDGSVVEESVAKDVDANFDGKIDMSDLTVLDQDWGRSLHTGSETFTGSGDKLDWASLDSQSNSTWDNTAFKEQNRIEADSAYVGSLAPTGDIDGGVFGDTADSDSQQII